MVGATMAAIPVIDLTDAASPDKSKREAVAKQLQSACENTGFFYISNSGVDPDLVSTVFDWARKFFALSQNDKESISYNENFRGYSDVLKENVNPENRGDLHESFDLDHKFFDGQSNGAGNLWPDSLQATNFRKDCMRYYENIRGLQQRLYPLLAIALDMPEDFFNPMLIKAGNIMRLLHYPAQTGPVDDRVMGIGAHTDYEVVTILAQQPGIKALQVLDQNGQWIDAPPRPDADFICNLGDMISRWSNDRFKSTMHRAINRTGQPRFSIPTFCGVEYNTIIEVLPSCVTADRPARYEPVKAGEWVQQRLAASYKPIDHGTAA